MVKVSVKWSSQTFTDIDVDVKEPLEVLQAQLFALTNVPIERQKIFLKGKWIKDSKLLEAVTEGAQLNLMGSADVLAQAPAKATVFVEDLSEKDKAALVPTLSAGLNNLGNTCYMNSTLQCLRHVTPFKDALRKYAREGKAPSGHAGDHHGLTRELGMLFSGMDSTTKAVTPFGFVTPFRTSFPQFDETDSEGRHKQQDAEECLQQVVSACAGTLRGANIIPGIGDDKTVDNAVDDIFGGEMVETLTCNETTVEAPRTVKTGFRKLRVFIDEKVNHMSEGIQRNLEEQLEKKSDTLGRTAVYTKKSAITRTPPYLIVQFIRFFWRNDTKKKAKIVRPVSFPDKLDIMPFTDDKFKASLAAVRRALNEEKEKELGIAKLKTKAAPLLPSMAKKEKEAKKEASPATSSAAAMDTTADKPAVAEPELVPRVATDSSGFYELMGVVTHVGRFADSGHYIGWARQSGDNWLKFDDSVVTPVTTDDIKAIATASPDTHMAYLCIYRRVDDIKGRAEALNLPAMVPIITAPPKDNKDASKSSSSAAVPSS